MKYVIASSIAMVVIFGLGYVVSYLVLRKRTVKHKGLLSTALTIVAGLLLLAIAGLFYFSNYSHADVRAKKALQGNSEVQVTKIDGGYFFDGKTSTSAIVFYPGAKVECEAYAPLMIKLAESGYDCFLADMPMNFALFGISVANKFVDAYNYKHWIIAGHSMGGTAAASYLQNTQTKFDGIILLAAYTTIDINDDIKLLSIYGSEDGCLERNVYTNNKVNWPVNSKEYVIQGGNHAQFGDYGIQKGDNVSTITAKEQIMATASVIADFFKK